ncbi:MAG: PAS domain S-box protein [Thermodesulfobacteriota bacterium]
MKLRIIILILSLLSFLSTGLGGYLYYCSLQEVIEHRAHAEATMHTRLVGGHIDDSLQAHQNSVQAMAAIRRLQTALAQPSSGTVAEANGVLRHFQQALEVDVCYLIDIDGNTIAASNWEEPDSFVGKNYRFRPYFQDAVQGRPGTYMALGVTSGRRGIYFSHPVGSEAGGPAQGVVVIKASTEAIDREMGEAREGVMIFVDPRGVVFLSNRQDWLYHTLWQLTEAERQEIRASQQFGDGPFPWTGIEFEEGGIARDRLGHSYRVHKVEVRQSPAWQLYYLHDLALVARHEAMMLRPTTGYVVLAVVLLTGIAVLLLYRFASGDIRRRRQAEEALAGAHRDLARRVEERTADLLQTNRQLTAEIEARRRAEGSLVSAKEHLQAIYDASPDMIFVHRADGGIVDVNENVVATYGFSREELAGILPSDISGAGCTSEMALERIAMTLKGENQNFEWTAKRKSGEEFPVEVRLSRLDLPADNDGRQPGVLAVVRDISERRRIEEHLRHSQKIEAVGKLAGGIAHDFNNILMAIMGYAELLRVDLPKGSPLLDSVDRIIASSERAAHLTRGLLAFSRKQLINPQPVDLNDVLAGVDRMLARLIPEDIHIETTGGAEPIIVQVDAAQFEQVIVNLATNARDAMPNGGILRLHAAIEELGEEFFRDHGAGRPGRYAALRVVDTGTGMDEETRRRVFEPFFTTKEVGKGTGLGLAMAYGIVKQHNGFIEVLSRLGQGTTVVIHLPLAETAAGSVQEKEASGETRPPRGREAILLAEDDDAVRTLMATSLRSCGYQVIEAGDGEAAVSRYRRHKDLRPLLLLDVIMPKKNGRQVLEEIREMAPEAKAIFVSGYSADILAGKGMRADDLDLLIKPVSPRTLLCKVREVLDR